MQGEGPGLPMSPPVSALHLRLTHLFLSLDADLAAHELLRKKGGVRTSQAQCQEAAGPGHGSSVTSWGLGPGHQVASVYSCVGGLTDAPDQELS